MNASLIVCLIMAIPFVKLGIENPGIDNNLIHSNQLKKRGNIVRSTGSASAEYLPRKALYNYEYLKDRSLEAILINGNGMIQNFKKKGTHVSFKATIETKSVIELPFIYYPGYVVKSGKEVIDTFETDNGLLGIQLSAGEYQIKSQYVGSNIMLIAYSVSFISVILFLFVVIKAKKGTIT